MSVIKGTNEKFIVRKNRCKGAKLPPAWPCPAPAAPLHFQEQGSWKLLRSVILTFPSSSGARGPSPLLGTWRFLSLKVLLASGVTRYGGRRPELLGVLDPENTVALFHLTLPSWPSLLRCSCDCFLQSPRQGRHWSPGLQVREDRAVPSPGQGPRFSFSGFCWRAPSPAQSTCGRISASPCPGWCREDPAPGCPKWSSDPVSCRGQNVASAFIRLEACAFSAWLGPSGVLPYLSIWGVQGGADFWSCATEDSRLAGLGTESSGLA